MRIGRYASNARKEVTESNLDRTRSPQVQEDDRKK